MLDWDGMELGRRLGRFINKATLEFATFFGKPELADRQAKKLGYDIGQRRQVLMDTHSLAAEKARIIYSNQGLERSHHEAYIKLSRDKTGESLNQYTQGTLFDASSVKP